MSDRAVVVLGMHRSGTSCVAGMLEAAGVAAAGDGAIRNWDNARGHHEMPDAIRLNEAVLAYSGGHWLAAPAEVRWTAAHADARDALLRAPVDGRAPLIKDPRALLVWPFWRASAVPFDVVAVVRHPLAVARSLESWRGVPLAEGVALWTAHVRALVEDQARHGYAVIDFDAPADAVIAAVAARGAALGRAVDADALAAAYDARLVHHDDGDAPDVPGLDEAIARHRRLVAPLGSRAAAPDVLAATVRSRFPRAALDAFARELRAGDVAAAVAHARAGLAAFEADPTAVLVPVLTALVHARALDDAAALIADHAPRRTGGFAELWRGKLELARGDAAAAVRYLEAAVAVAPPLYQAIRLLPQALRAAGRSAEARAALHRAAHVALYPHGPLATLAEWSWLDGDRAMALVDMATAIAAAPVHRRGRLRTRRAEWLVATGDADAARAELQHAIAEDPGYARSRDVLATLR